MKIYMLQRIATSSASEVYYNFQNLQSSIASACNQQVKDKKSAQHIKLEISVNN